MAEFHRQLLVITEHPNKLWNSILLIPIRVSPRHPCSIFPFPLTYLYYTCTG